MITAYCLEWQIKGGSARDLVVEPLKPFINVQLKAWDGVRWPGNYAHARRNELPIIFSHLLPPMDLLTDDKVKLVWLPMWDHVRGYSQEWWDSLPKTLRIVAFSQAVADKARKAGLATLQLRYFKNPGMFSPVQWTEGYNILYWNRIGMVGPQFLKKMCSILKVNKLIFRQQIDPRISERFAYALPARLGKTRIEKLPGFIPRSEYLRILSRVNIFLAPRLYEGVGLSFIEALAQGCAVFSFNAPTMNEYITSGKDGYLFQSFRASKMVSYAVHGKRLVGRVLVRAGVQQGIRFQYPVTTYQNWNAISTLDLEKLGQAARKSHQIGFDEWRQGALEYANFVLKW